MSPELSRQLSEILSKYYCKMRTVCHYKAKSIGMAPYAEDFLHNALLLFMRMPDDRIQSVFFDEFRGEKHFYNLILSMVRRETIDRVRARRSLFNLDDQYEALPLSEDDPIRWAELSEEDYARFREVSCNLRSDDFLIPLPNGMYVRPTQGWVSGWIHSYSIKNRRYTYWLYSAFVGSRSKGEHPRRLKTSSSRHEAYMALMEYSTKITESEYESRMIF